MHQLSHTHTHLHMQLMELVKSGMSVDDALAQAEWMAIEEEASKSAAAAAAAEGAGSETVEPTAEELPAHLERVLADLNLPEASRVAVRSMSTEQQREMIRSHVKLTARTSSSVTSRNVDKAGWLTKAPPLNTVDEQSVKRWQRRWFELRGTTLVYWASDDKSVAPKGEIDLCDTTRFFRQQPSIRHEHAFTIEVTTSDADGSGAVAASRRTYFLKADTARERSAWADKIAAAVARGTGGKASIIVSAPPPPVMRGAVQPPPLAADADPDYCGFLVKSPKLTTVDELSPMRWQRRWFVLKGMYVVSASFAYNMPSGSSSHPSLSPVCANVMYSMHVH